MAALLLIKLRTCIPIVRLEDIATKQAVRVLKSVGPESGKEVLVGVVGSPDLVAMVGEGVSIHAGKNDIRLLQQRGPLLERGEGCLKLVVEEDGTKREEYAWCGGRKGGDKCIACREVAPKAGGQDTRVLG
ncbi:hypothetical protein HYQ46_001517 [Verticillium longisporum]|nr:hypothetical protein HYQ46_001517 [Verticillium longisporum]